MKVERPEYFADICVCGWQVEQRDRAIVEAVREACIEVASAYATGAGYAIRALTTNALLEAVYGAD